MPQTSYKNEKCKGCQHANCFEDTISWCYMFHKQPGQLPCTQHDKFKEERQAVGKFIIKLVK